MKEKAGAFSMRIFVKMVDPAPVEVTGTPDHSMDLITFFQKQLCKIRSILAGNSCNQSGFLHEFS
jgi:hypothetical protein